MFGNLNATLRRNIGEELLQQTLALEQGSVAQVHTCEVKEIERKTDESIGPTFGNIFLELVVVGNPALVGDNGFAVEHDLPGGEFL